jgi:hypothetical protein
MPPEGIVIRSAGDHRVNGKSRAEARGVFREDNMDGSGDAASLGVVDAVPWGVRRIANHNTTECIFAEFPMQLVGHLREDGAPEDAELGCVWHRRRKESDGRPPVRPTERL